MFSVIFEARPRADQWQAYLGYAELLRPKLVAMEGFIANARYRSRRRPGWVLSVSTWCDEAALIRWRGLPDHHAVQAKGRSEVFDDYRLRVGRVLADSNPPEGETLDRSQPAESGAGDQRLVSIVEMAGAPAPPEPAPAAELARAFGLPPDAAGIADWDLFDALAPSRDRLLLVSWRGREAAEALPAQRARRRLIRIIRDYGMFERGQAPQSWPEQRLSA